LNRVTVYVPEFLYSLLFVMNVEIVVAPLPERMFLALNRHGYLQGLYCLGKDRLVRLADQQMNSSGMTTYPLTTKP